MTFKAEVINTSIGTASLVNVLGGRCAVFLLMSLGIELKIFSTFDHWGTLFFGLWLGA